MVHVSSAYVNSFLNETQEILYPPPENAEKVIDLASSLSEGNDLDLFYKSIIFKRLFTKLM